MSSKKAVHTIVVLIVVLVFSVNAYSQEPKPDSLQFKTTKTVNEKVHSPKRASVYSAVLPGLGQAYNKKYWKIPLVYAGFGTIGYFIGWNNKFYKSYKNAYSDLTDKDSGTNSFLDIEAAKYYNLDDPTEFSNFKSGLYKQQEYFRRNRDLLIISIIGFYGLNIIDASVDAHLFDFDISEDLSMNWQPAVQTSEKQLVYGLNFTLNF